MSLTGRALHVGSEGELCSPDRGPLVEKLRASVYELIPAAEIAVQAAQKPNLAKSEIKGACRQVFQGDAWSGVEPAERARLVRDLLEMCIRDSDEPAPALEDAFNPRLVVGWRAGCEHRELRALHDSRRFGDAALLLDAAAAGRYGAVPQLGRGGFAASVSYTHLDVYKRQR